jgi:hypothetical protein
MTCAKTGLTALRIPAVLLALAAFGLGIWSKFRQCALKADLDD